MNSDTTILHLINDYSGASRYSCELLSALEHDNTFEVVCVCISHKNREELTIEMLNKSIVVYIPIFRFVTKNENISFLSLIIKILSVYVVFGEKIIIHDNGNNLLTDKCVQYSRYKFLHTLHFLNNDKSVLNRMILDKFDAVICVTQYAHNSINGSCTKLVRQIYNGVCEVNATEQREHTRSLYGFISDEILVIYVGRIEESKGIGLLAKVFSEIGRCDIRLVVVGDGAYDMVFDQIKANHSKITFLGNICNQEVHNLMAACDIGVIPSLNEQCSYVALEMMSHGMAIIASEVRGMGELFIGRDIALTVPVDYSQDDIPTLDTEVLKQHIITLASDINLRKRLGENARREWAEKYTAERMARETFEVYKELAAQF